MSEASQSGEEIAGVVVQSLKTHRDGRGFFREIIRDNDDFFQGAFGQWSHSRMGPQTVKAWHFHHRQTDWWYCPLGLIEAVLFDYRPESPTFKTKMVLALGDEEQHPEAVAAVIKIPPGVLHGCRVIEAPAHLLYVTSHIYDPEDEGRYPFNGDIVPHHWGDEATLVVADRDRRTHIPRYERAKME